MVLGGRRNVTPPFWPLFWLTKTMQRQIMITLQCQRPLAERRQIIPALSYWPAGREQAFCVTHKTIHLSSITSVEKSLILGLPPYQTVEWPSGLRRCLQVQITLVAWVRTPPLPNIFCWLLIISKRTKIKNNLNGKHHQIII